MEADAHQVSIFPGNMALCQRGKFSTFFDVSCDLPSAIDEVGFGSISFCDSLLEIAVMPFDRRVPMGSNTVKHDPSPTLLDTDMVPSCAFTSCRARDRPRPVPPCVRVLDMSTCLNGRNTASSMFSGMPSP